MQPYTLTDPSLMHSALAGAPCQAGGNGGMQLHMHAQRQVPTSGAANANNALHCAGETTELGVPRPTSGGGDGQGSSGSGSSSGRGAGGQGSGPGESNLVESEMPDRTGTYAAMGALIGAFLGWASQFV